MTELERLRKISEGLDAISLVRQDEISDGYKQLVMKALTENNFDTTKIDHIHVDVALQLTDEYSRDFIEVCIKRDSVKDYYYEFDVYVRKSNVTFNNCCSGEWVQKSGYHYYLKAMSIIADISDQLLNYGLMQDRKPLEDAFEARMNASREENRIISEERARALEAKKQEIEKAEYLGHYSLLRSYEDGYVEGEETYKLIGVYKVLKETNKFVHAVQYYNNEYTEDDDKVDPDTLNAYRPSRWIGYSSEQRFRKENLYNVFWRSITKEDVQIID